jgi:hypothetical protein
MYRYYDGEITCLSRGTIYQTEATPMRTALLRAGILWLATTSLRAGPCMPGPLTNYFGSTTCTVGPVTFKDFSFSAIAFSNPGVVIPASAVQVTPVSAFPSYGFKFSSTGFHVTGSDFVTYRLAYVADPIDIRGLEDILDVNDQSFSFTAAAFSKPVSPGSVQIDTDGCLGAAFGPTCPFSTVTFSVFDNGITSRLQNSAFFSSQSIVGIRNTISLNANGAIADFNGFTNGSIVPEPATALLAGMGVLLLAVVKLRAR